MRILLIHSFYRHKGGEDVVFEQELELLKKFGNVRALSFQNEEGLRGGMQFIFSIWNFLAARKVREAVKDFKPDIVHIYNWHFATGPIIIRTAFKSGCKVILSVGNYRLLCPSGTLTHNGKLYLASISKARFPWNAVFHRVYRQSYFQTFWLAFIVWIHKRLGTWDEVDGFVVPTNLVKLLFTSSHNYLRLSAKKFIVKPNFSNPVSNNFVKRKNHFLYIGRLSEEKGITLLLEAFNESPFELLIAGTGPLLDKVSSSAALRPNIKYIGLLNKDEVQDALIHCTALVFPSICYETFGMVITEAFSCACPVIASDIGSPSEIVEEGITGFHFSAGDRNSLRSCLEKWQTLSDEKKEEMQRNCLNSFNINYTPEKNLEQLNSIYHLISQN
jgi:glycosyltransferase involved in cell wall biosynthesis